MTRRQQDHADRTVVAWAARRCLLLTTYRRDGTAVASPVWFVTAHGEIRLWTDSGAGKVKRLRRDTRCLIAPCTFSGRVTGPARAGTARILPVPEGPQVQALLRAKYPIQKRALDAYTQLRRRGHPTAPDPGTYVAITVTD
ncbi:MAG: PPOX class F420-dependent oxidoreductase [Jatrophihabitantaceae bacterium]